MARYTVAAILGLLASLGGTAALAGLGDLDPDYGADGRLTAATIFYDPNIRPASDLVTLNLPDDRLITVEGSLVRRFDSEGRPDLTFGDNGATAFPLPDATPFFSLLSNPVATPDGGLLLAALLRDELGTSFFEALIRLDRDGQLLTSFGGNGDGVYRLTTASIPEICGGICTELMGVAVDPAGRVLLAKRGWSALGRCSGTPRVDRLTPNGAIDTTFGVNGRSDVTGVDLCTGSMLFHTRDDSGVLVGSGRAVIGLTATGERDVSFGVHGMLALDHAVGWLSGLPLPDGGVLLAGSRLPPSQPEIMLAKFNASGQPDAMFGDGTGAVQQDLGQALLGISGLRPHVSAMVSTVDGGQLYLQVSLMRSDGEAVCAGGIARLSGNGTIDSGFGEEGLTCLDYGAFPFALIGLQRDGAPLFGQLDGNVYRLLLDSAASPGFLTLKRSGVTHEVGEKDSSATISVVRTAGRDGVASAHFYTSAASPVCHCPGCCHTSHIAGADSDYLTTSGRLEWADGESGPRSANIEILDDLDEEGREIFLVNFDDPQGGAQFYGVHHKLIIGINDDDSDDNDNDNDDDDSDDDVGSAEADDVPSGDSPSGGGGSIPWYVVAALAAFAVRSLAQPPSKRLRKIKNTAARMHKAAHR